MTVVVVCRQDFCRILEHVWQNEGLTEVQHGELTLLGHSVSRAPVKSMTEVFLIQTDPERAERLENLLRACPIHGERGAIFALFTLGD